MPFWRRQGAAGLTPSRSSVEAVRPGFDEMSGETIADASTAVSKGRGLTPPSSDQYVMPQRPASPLGSGEGIEQDATLLDPLRYLRPAMGASTLYSIDNMHVRIFDWLNTTFPHVDNRFVNGAQGGVGSGYFGWCFSAFRSSSMFAFAVSLAPLMEVGLT